MVIFVGDFSLNLFGGRWLTNCLEYKNMSQMSIIERKKFYPIRYLESIFEVWYNFQNFVRDGHYIS